MRADLWRIREHGDDRMMELAVAYEPDQYRDIRGRVQKIGRLAGASLLFLSQSPESVLVVLTNVTEDILARFEKEGFTPGRE